MKLGTPIGGAFLHIEDPFQPAVYKSTVELFYVSKNADGCLLSLACCKALGIVSQDFPRLGRRVGNPDIYITN